MDVLVVNSCRYSIEIRDHAELFEGNLRDYVWRGGVATADINIDADPEPEILAGQNWCFVYGEADWTSGATVVEDGQTILKIFRHYKRAALINDLIKKSCE